jgi:hypothetical protein
MKKLLYTLLAVSIIFSTCKKEDEEPTNTGNNNNNNTGNTTATIIGEWNLKTMGGEYTIDDGTLEVPDITFFPYESFLVGSGDSNDGWENNNVLLNPQVFYRLEFYEDQQVKSTGDFLDGIETYYGTWVLNGDNLYMTIPEEQTNFDNDDLARPIKIDLLDNTRLHLTVQYYLYDGREQGYQKYFFERL